MRLEAYNRGAAAAYAHRWAYGRNPRYYDYTDIGGDCTNFISQCLYAGAQVMDYRPTFGWYYIDANRKAPAWTGVRYLDQYLRRTGETPGPAARAVTVGELQTGDVVQLSGDGVNWTHSLLVVDPAGPLVAAHDENADYRPLSDYDYAEARCLHIFGVYKP